MNLIRVLGVVAMVFLPAAARGQSKPTIKEIVQRESPAVVAVYNLDTEGKLRGTGTGFIVKPDGVIITNYHVIEGASEALIKLKNGEVYDRVLVIDAHPRRDIAILKIEAMNLPTVTLGDSEKADAGDAALAIGNPKGLEHTVSNGLISARRIIQGTQMLQISVPISPGSSGGPLYNERGEVIGITSSGIVEEGAQNLNFAIPLKYAIVMLDGSLRMTLGEVAQRFGKPSTPAKPASQRSEPAPPPEPAPAPPEEPVETENRFSDPAGLASVVVEPGWTPGPGIAPGVIIGLRAEIGNMQIMYMAGVTDVKALFDIGENAAKSAMKDFKRVSDPVEGTYEGKPNKVGLYQGKVQGLKMSAFVAATITAKGGLLCLGFTQEGRGEEVKAMGRMFLSLR